MCKINKMNCVNYCVMTKLFELPAFHAAPNERLVLPRCSRIGRCMKGGKVQYALSPWPSAAARNLARKYSSSQGISHHRGNFFLIKADPVCAPATVAVLPPSPPPVELKQISSQTVLFDRTNHEQWANLHKLIPILLPVEAGRK